MEHRIIVTKSGCVTCFKESQYKACVNYMKDLADQHIAFSYEFA